ncbi:helix-turn-helix transcriptional regulator [Rhizobium sp. BG4]|uniref:helix-turn-helix domain-containing protein n=1 Tax=Rhizobium sp. BG4 TaxID=2613770 RepID=UPI00193CB2F5|nr:helix-turn-helix transcriptional regulator [Rhizobium sp. BG4]QRM45337.1 hypothetical protein F2982_18965 [Rhizobium sp. BG4]
MDEFNPPGTAIEMRLDGLVDGIRRKLMQGDIVSVSKATGLTIAGLYKIRNNPAASPRHETLQLLADHFGYQISIVDHQPVMPPPFRRKPKKEPV